MNIKPQTTMVSCSFTVECPQYGSRGSSVITRC